MEALFDVSQLTQFEFGAIVISVLIAGLVFGCLIAYAILNRKNSPNAAAAVKVQEEFEQYKEKVDEHFNKTSEMFKDVTTQYKKLYDHMAVGAIELSNADTISMPRLEMQESKSEQEDEQIEQTGQTDPDPSEDIENTQVIEDTPDHETDQSADPASDVQPAEPSTEDTKTG